MHDDNFLGKLHFESPVLLILLTPFNLPEPLLCCQNQSLVEPTSLTQTAPTKKNTPVGRRQYV